MSVSLPIIIAWGLPIALLSFFGNIFFLPFLIIFLFLSSLVFVTELFCIPNNFLIFLLDLVRRMWSFFLQALDRSFLKFFLLEIPAGSSVFLFSIFIIMILLICLKLKNRLFRCLVLIIFSIIVCFALKTYCSRFGILRFKEGTKKVFFVKFKKKIIGVDTGVKSKWTENWVKYRIIPQLRKRFGSTKIEWWIILKPTSSSYKLLQEVLANSLNTKIVIPKCSSYVPKNTKESIESIKEWAKINCSGVIIISRDTRKFRIIKDKDDKNFINLLNIGTLARTKKFSQIVVILNGVLAQEKIEILPIIAKNEKLTRLTSENIS